MPHLFWMTWALWTWWPYSLSSILLGDEQESKLGGVDECIFAAFLLNVFAWVVIGFWYFTALPRTFCVCFDRIPERKETIRNQSKNPSLEANTPFWRNKDLPNEISSMQGKSLGRPRLKPPWHDTVRPEPSARGRTVRSYHAASGPPPQMESPRANRSDQNSISTPENAEHLTSGRDLEGELAKGFIRTTTKIAGGFIIIYTITITISTSFPLVVFPLPSFGSIQVLVHPFVLDPSIYYDDESLYVWVDPLVLGEYGEVLALCIIDL